jgi:hypothetical protein
VRFVAFAVLPQGHEFLLAMARFFGLCRRSALIRTIGLKEMRFGFVGE